MQNPSKEQAIEEMKRLSSDVLVFSAIAASSFNAESGKWMTGDWLFDAPLVRLIAPSAISQILTIYLAF